VSRRRRAITAQPFATLLYHAQGIPCKHPVPAHRKPMGRSLTPGLPLRPDRTHGIPSVDRLGRRYKCLANCQLRRNGSEPLLMVIVRSWLTPRAGSPPEESRGETSDSGCRGKSAGRRRRRVARPSSGWIIPDSGHDGVGRLRARPRRSGGDTFGRERLTWHDCANAALRARYRRCVDRRRAA
jgi:hypothetical protein